MSSRSPKSMQKQQDSASEMASRLRKRRLRSQQLQPLDRHAARETRLKFWTDHDRLAAVEQPQAADG